MTADVGQFWIHCKPPVWDYYEVQVRESSAFAFQGMLHENTRCYRELALRCWWLGHDGDIFLGSGSLGKLAGVAKFEVMLYNKG